MDKNQFAQQVVNHLLEKDYFSKWLGIEILEIKDGCS
jgi:hypothetical protein